jgi:hypothetical protein
VTAFEHGRSEVKLQTQYDPNLPKDLKFFLATPNGQLSATIDNPAVLPMFKPGAAFYVDIIPVTEGE